MMFKIIFSLGALLFTIRYDYMGCNKKKNYIVWNEKKLEWKDFQNEGYTEPGVDAASSVKIKFDYEVSSFLKHFSIFCLFFKKESLSKADRTDYVLKHEQGHFDIGEIFARKLRKKILQIRNSINRSNYRVLDSIFHTYNEMMIAEQKFYDRETKHSNDKLQQKVWDFKIQKSLDSLMIFSNNKY